jgi:hypothetical protein
MSEKQKERLPLWVTVAMAVLIGSWQAVAWATPYFERFVKVEANQNHIIDAITRIEVKLDKVIEAKK